MKEEKEEKRYLPFLLVEYTVGLGNKRTNPHVLYNVPYLHSI